MMNELFMNSVCFGFAATIGAYLLGIEIKKRINLAIMNPLLVAVILVISFLLVFRIDYKVYEAGSRYTYL